MDGLKWFYLFMFGVFVVGIIGSNIENDKTKEYNEARCKMAFNMAMSQRDSVMINIANPACEYEWTRSVTIFHDTLP